ncbi:lipoprotein, putative [Edwardsiella ictaluri 93-146]|uniref:Lipoprotein, putative n=1 Tax=Edwardsiella ictaluri (strain 93-146) TaxID=634503 RepID=C5BA69_EDWI9|nr:lipoprotein, putative [Edwardsiella ictaluri 93-146]
MGAILKSAATPRYCYFQPLCNNLAIACTTATHGHTHQQSLWCDISS